jgi:multisubunit Na+/H+ antiporter MnhG subunit
MNTLIWIAVAIGLGMLIVIAIAAVIVARAAMKQGRPEAESDRTYTPKEKTDGND